NNVTCTRDGKTLLDFALEGGNIDIINMVWGLTHLAACLGAGETPLHFLVRQDNVSVDNVERILPSRYVDENVNINIDVNAGRRSKNGTALHIAAKKGNCTVVRLLMRAEAMIDAID